MYRLFKLLLVLVVVVVVALPSKAAEPVLIARLESGEVVAVEAQGHPSGDLHFYVQGRVTEAAVVVGLRHTYWEHDAEHADLQPGSWFVYTPSGILTLGGM